LSHGAGEPGIVDETYGEDWKLGEPGTLEESTKQVKERENKDEGAWVKRKTARQTKEERGTANRSGNGGVMASGFLQQLSRHKNTARTEHKIVKKVPQNEQKSPRIFSRKEKKANGTGHYDRLAHQDGSRLAQR
jgi:hypothetical protein